jgi:hypothetical protein
MPPRRAGVVGAPSRLPMCSVASGTPGAASVRVRYGDGATNGATIAGGPYTHDHPVQCGERPMPLSWLRRAIIA